MANPEWHPADVDPPWEDDDQDPIECIWCQHPATRCRCDAIYDNWKDNQL